MVGLAYATWRRPTAPPPCHITNPWESLHTTSPPLIQVGLIHRMRLSCLGSTGPLSSTWRGQTDLQTAFLTTAIHLPAMQPPPRAIKHRWMARRWDGRLANAPLCRPMPPCLSIASSLPTSTPCPLHTIKEVVVLGGDHHSSSSQAFQVFQALRSSPE